MEDFVINAILAGIGLALTTGPISCFVLWKRMSYFGDALSHSALLGIAFGILLEVNLTIAALILASLFSAIYILFNKRHTSDSLLAIISQGFLAMALLMISSLDHIRIDISSYLFGDILAANNNDILTIAIITVIILAWLVINWQKLLLITINEDLAATDKIPVKSLNLQFMLVVSFLIAIAIKIVGALLITSMLIVPAVIAGNFSKNPLNMVINASIISCVSVIGGLLSSVNLDTPSGPSIVVCSIILFCLSSLFAKQLRRWL